jgi:hypothetical protein
VHLEVERLVPLPEHDPLAHGAAALHVLADRLLGGQGPAAGTPSRDTMMF